MQALRIEDAGPPAGKTVEAYFDRQETGEGSHASASHPGSPTATPEAPAVDERGQDPQEATPAPEAESGVVKHEAASLQTGGEPPHGLAETPRPIKEVKGSEGGKASSAVAEGANVKAEIAGEAAAKVQPSESPSPQDLSTATPPEECRRPVVAATAGEGVAEVEAKEKVAVATEGKALGFEASGGAEKRVRTSASFSNKRHSDQSTHRMPNVSLCCNCCDCLLHLLVHSSWISPK